MASSERFREQLLLSLDDEGLEDLTHRLVLQDYPGAYRTGRGKDEGVDVISDQDNPPERGWQCKNFGDRIEWGHCRAALRSAMDSGAPPRHYTFVFPRRLKLGERKHWRDTFRPTEQAQYPDLDVLDLWDDLGRRLEARPELVDLLSDGALAGYARRVAEQTAQTGVHPFATAVEVTQGASSVAEHAVEIGRADPRYAYEVAGREATAEDAGLLEGRTRFMLQRKSGSQPRYSMTLRQGPGVREVTAAPRQGVAPAEPEIWFADSPDGEHAWLETRLSLARGQAVSFGPNDPVGLDPGELPDRFHSVVDEDGLLRNGELEVGLSEPLLLRMTLRLPDQNKTEVRAGIPLYRVPPKRDASLSYAGAIGVAAVFLDIQDKGETDAETQNAELNMEMALAISDGDDPTYALRGIGFSQAFGNADEIHLDCPDLFPEGGLSASTPSAASDETDLITNAVALVATALSKLNDRDGNSRTMQTEIGPADEALASLVIRILSAEVLRIPAEGEFEVATPDGTTLRDDLDPLLKVHLPVPDLCGQSTGLTMEQTVEGADPLELVEHASGRVFLRCRSNNSAAVVIRALSSQ